MTRKRKIIAISVIVLLGAGLTVFLVMRDTGPPVVVHGNLSEKDVAQIKSAVRWELWHEAVPNFSKKSIKDLPPSIGRALNMHVSLIEGEKCRMAFSRSVNGLSLPVTVIGGVAYASFPYSTNFPTGRYILTNGPSGWACCRSYTAEWVSSLPPSQ